mmetsp:Transcript_12614/g.34990  ORF Transcript_12614/g.34990 Transcript_12614/m.34990 type:complete len:255 (-) Transcript_12614:37-801(-)
MTILQWRKIPLNNLSIKLCWSLPCMKQKRKYLERAVLFFSLTNLRMGEPAILSDEDTNAGSQQSVASQTGFQLPISSPLIDSLCQNSSDNDNEHSRSLLWEQEAKQQLGLRDPNQGLGADFLEKPKRSLSAYNYFFQAERVKLLQALPGASNQDNDDSNGSTEKLNHKKTPCRKIGFANMARVISSKWKNISEEEKAPYVAMAKQDSTRYKQEMNEWKLKAANRVTNSTSVGDGYNAGLVQIPWDTVATATVNL